MLEHDQCQERELFFVVLGEVPSLATADAIFNPVVPVSRATPISDLFNLVPRWRPNKQGLLRLTMYLTRSASVISPTITLHLSFRGKFHRHGRLLALANSTSAQRIGKGNRRELSVDDLPGPHAHLTGISLAKKFISDGFKLLPFQQKRADSDAGKIILKAQVRNVEKFGPIFRSKYTGLRPVKNVKISNPSDVATVLRAESHIPIRPNVPVREYYRTKTSKPAGLIFDNGRDWYKHRRAVNERMLQPKRVVKYETAFNEIVTDFVHRLEKLRGSHGLENEIPLLEKELFKWSFESVSQVLFDERFGSLEDEVKPDIQEFINAVYNFLATSADVDVQPLWLIKIFQTKMYKQFAESHDKLYEFTEKCIKRKLNEYEKQEKLQDDTQSEKMEFLKYLVSTSDLTYEDLLATYVDIYFAGVDTTATAILWTLYQLAKHQDKQLKLREEISTALKPGELVTSKSLSKMPYLKVCVKEVLRLYPVYYLHRVTEQDLVLSGYKIPAGTQVMILSHAMGISEQYFEDPSSFKPERWLRTKRRHTESSANVENAFASLPFGFGTRMCVGRRVSELEQYILLARIIQNYEVYSVDQTVERTTHGLVIMPDRPLRIQFVKRA